MANLRLLTRHFFDGLLRPETAGGEDSFLEWLTQIMGVLIAASWMFPAQLHGHYAHLHALPDPAAYRLACRADFLAALLLMSLLVALVVAIEWPMLFPSQRDHLVLSPLPVTRLELFGAKLLALLLFVSLFVLAIALVSGLALPAMATGHWEPRSLLLRAAAHLVAALAACYFVFFALLAAQGVLLVILPNRWFPSASFGVQSLILLALLCGFPTLPYFPARQLVDAAWLPPAWFLGLAEALMGQPNANARRAALVLAAAAAVSFFCYAWCYLRFRQHALDLPGHQRAGGCGWWRPPDAIAEFVTLTMARARDQKLVLLLILGLGVGLVFESGVYLFRRVERYGWVATSGRIEGAALGLPLILAFFALVGLRRAFRLPVEPAANWLFRLAETPASRTRWLRSTFSTLFCLGAVAPIALCAPAHFALLPAGTAVAVIAWQLLMLAAYANYLMLDWNAVPFAATHNPAQRHLLQSVVFHSAEFAPFVFGGATMIGAALPDLPLAIAWTVFLVFAVCWLRRSG